MKLSINQTKTRFFACSTTSETFLFIFLFQVVHLKKIEFTNNELFYSNSSSDRLGGAKADRRKEAAISTAIESYLKDHKPQDAGGRMSRGKVVIFFKYCFPSFLEIVIKVILNEKQRIDAFRNDSVFNISSRIPCIEY